MVRILTAWSVLWAQTCGLWPGLLGHAPVTPLWPPGKLARRRLFSEREREKAEAQGQREKDRLKSCWSKLPEC